MGNHRPLTDPLGLPLGGQQPQPAPQGSQVNPVLMFLIPSFYQTIQTMIGNREIGKDPAKIVEEAWIVASRAFGKLGFEYVAPLGVKAKAAAD